MSALAFGTLCQDKVQESEKKKTREPSPDGSRLPRSADSGKIGEKEADVPLPKKQIFLTFSERSFKNSHAERYVNVTPTGKAGNVSYDYVYQYKDHLGNVRLDYAPGEPVLGQPVTLVVLEENHYYPFGMKHKGYNTSQYGFVEVENGNDYYVNIAQLPPDSASLYKYKYNGKEYQDELGLNMYDYGARNYDPALGRWMNIDPLAEVSRRWSPYTYAYNNPVSFIDPDGMLSQSFMDKILNSASGTTWTNNDNGTFTSNTGETTSDREESPADIITVGKDGKVKDRKIDNRPNVFLDEDGNTLDLNDVDGLDSPMLTKKFKKGDKVYHLVSFKDMAKAMSKAGSIKYNKGANALQRAWFNLKYAKASYYQYDFGHTYFKPLLNISSKDMGELYYGSGYVSSVPFIRFEGSTTLYNVPDAGNFMWGHRAFLNNLPSNVMLNAAAKNEGGSDTDADTQAIKAGYNYK